MSSGEPTLRMAEPADAEAMAACVTEAYQHYVGRMGKPPGPMLADYDAIVREHHAYVAQSGDGQICGVLVLMESSYRILLDNVAVSEQWRGKGLGKRLMEFAEDLARDRGWRDLDLYTHELMTENIAMYLRLGYVETGRRQEQGYDRIYMRKTL